MTAPIPRRDRIGKLEAGIICSEHQPCTGPRRWQRALSSRTSPGSRTPSPAHGPVPIKVGRDPPLKKAVDMQPTAGALALALQRTRSIVILPWKASVSKRTPLGTSGGRSVPTGAKGCLPLKWPLCCSVAVQVPSAWRTASPLYAKFMSGKLEHSMVRAPIHWGSRGRRTSSEPRCTTNTGKGRPKVRRTFPVGRASSLPGRSHRQKSRERLQPCETPCCTSLGRRQQPLPAHHKWATGKGQRGGDQAMISRCKYDRLQICTIKTPTNTNYHRKFGYLSQEQVVWCKTRWTK